jgi:hypothetical protein
VSSALWRGYVGTWEIVADSLVLRKIEIEERIEGRDGWRWRDVTAKYFPGSPLQVTWYSGTLIIPRGEVVDYVHMGYGSTYERYTLITIKAGHLERRRDMSLDEFTAYRRAKFNQFKATGAYKQKLEDAMRTFQEEAEAEEFLFQFYSELYLSLPEQMK